MKRKTFLKVSSVLASAPFFSSFNRWRQPAKLKNWAENFEFSTSNVFYPRSVAEVQELVKRCSRLRALGTRHCFNKIADSKDNLISTKEMNKVIALDTNALTVTVEGGIKYGEL